MQDEAARDRDALTHATRELVRILVRVLVDIETDSSDPLAGPRLALVAAHASTLEAERDVVEHGAVVERRVVLKHHPAVRTGALNGLAVDQHLAFRRRMLRLQTRDLTQHRRLAAAGRTEYRDEFTDARSIIDTERHIANRGEGLLRSRRVRLGDALELDDGRRRPGRSLLGLRFR